MSSLIAVAIITSTEFTLALEFTKQFSEFNQRNLHNLFWKNVILQIQL